MALATVGGVAVGRGVVEPGWRWSEHARQLAGTASCQSAHTGYLLGGRMGVRMNDGTEGEAGVGDDGATTLQAMCERCGMVDHDDVAVTLGPGMPAEYLARRRPRRS